MEDRAMGMEDLFQDGRDEVFFDNAGDIAKRMYILAGQLFCGAGMSAWLFNKNGQLYNNVFPSYHDFLLFFRLGGCLDYAMEQKGKVHVPMLLTDPLNLVWLAEWSYEWGEPWALFVFGPVFSTRSSVREVENALRRLEVSVRLQNTLVDKLGIVPVLSHQTITQYAKMLHYTVTGMSVDIGGIHYQKTGGTIGGVEGEEPLADSNPEQRRAIEKGMLQMVREGNVFGLASADKLSAYATGAIFVTDDSKRDSKNALIIFVALCARAAMDGGLSPKEARELESHYIRTVEKSTRASELMSLKKMILEDFTTRVHATREKPEVSQAERECCAYINSHLRDSLELTDIARAMGYTEYYLTKKFHKETGMRLADYIKGARIEQAKIMLMSNDTIQSIADELQFSSRSFFTKVFKEVVGVSPAEYREMNGRGVGESEGT